jgi:hypothetical protein
MRYLSPLAEAEINTLEDEGIDLDAGDVVRINELAKRVESPRTRMELSRGRPVPVGGVVLWPLTLYASDWFQRIGGNLRGETQQTYALAYAMSNGGETLPECPKEAARLIGRWGRSLKCTWNQLVEAIRQIHDQWDLPDTGEKGQAATAGELSSMLAAMTGTPPAVWEYQCSVKYVLAMLDIITSQNAAEGQSSKHDPRIKAERALGLVMEKIREKHRGKCNV